MDVTAGPICYIHRGEEGGRGRGVKEEGLRTRNASPRNIRASAGGVFKHPGRPGGGGGGAAIAPMTANNGQPEPKKSSPLLQHVYVCIYSNNNTYTSTGIYFVIFNNKTCRSFDSLKRCLLYYY